eukprot:scaffold35741_cov152-Isochrysis_galbana.AAC.1
MARARRSWQGKSVLQIRKYSYEYCVLQHPLLLPQLRLSTTNTRDIEIPPDLLHIRWLQHGRYTKLLGVPFWASGEDNSFWDDLYIKIKSAIAAWRDLTTRLTQHGRVMLANFMIYSRPRYWAQAMLPPPHFNRHIKIKTRMMASWSTKSFLTVHGRVQLANLICYGIHRYWIQSMAQLNGLMKTLTTTYSLKKIPRTRLFERWSPDSPLCRRWLAHVRYFVEVNKRNISRRSIPYIDRLIRDHHELFLEVPEYAGLWKPKLQASLCTALAH